MGHGGTVAFSPDLAFNGVPFEIIDHEGERWVTLTALATALGYKDFRQMHNLIKRNVAEFVYKTKKVAFE